ncbi:MAG: DUF3347 domain-containing protein [Flavobacteriaceae bacterium]|nr:DUF3347 domain-containing protein [Flavobacteriaceae bacterium]
MKKWLNILVLGLIAVVVFACKKEDKPSPAENGEAQEIQAQFTEGAIALMYEKYLELSEALVATDAESAAQAGLALASAAESIHASHPLIDLGKTIAHTSAVEQQRELFSKVTHQIEEELLNYLSEGSTIYKVYCPMVNNNQGDYWLSDRDEVLNPYFGDRMLKCGRVAEKLMPLQ